MKALVLILTLVLAFISGCSTTPNTQEIAGTYYQDSKNGKIRYTVLVPEGTSLAKKKECYEFAKKYIK